MISQGTTATSRARVTAARRGTRPSGNGHGGMRQQARDGGGKGEATGGGGGGWEGGVERERERERRVGAHKDESGPAVMMSRALTGQWVVRLGLRGGSHDDEVC